MKLVPTIRLRVWLPLMVLVAFTLMLSLFSIIQIIDFEHYLKEQTYTNLKQRISRSAERIEKFLQFNLPKQVEIEISDFAVTEEVEEIALIDGNGRVLYGSQVEWKNMLVQEILPNFNYSTYKWVRNIRKPVISISHNRNYYHAYNPIILAATKGEIMPTEVGVLYLEYNISHIRASREQILLRQFFIVWGVGLLLILSLVIVLNYWFLRPLRTITEIIADYGLQDYSRRVNLYGKSELSLLGATLNHMADELLKANNKAKESDHLKSAFLANMSHEIRTPMNGILGFSELLKDAHLTDKNKDKFIGIVHKSANQLLNIINDIIAVSRIEAGHESLHLEDVNMSILLDELSDFFLPLVKQKNISFKCYKKWSHSSLIVTADKIKLWQILVNLVGNAIKFTDKGGVDVQCECRAGMLLISIRDTGIGIEPHLTQVIFERFRQAETSLSRKYGGTGLGLSISRSYAEMMGGTISVNSTPGVGSLFTISLPYTPPIEMVQNTITDNDVPIEIPNWKDKVILLAEDDEDSSYLTDQILLETGITIIQVENGNEAVEKCKTNDAIQLVLMDMGLPGINGFEATPLIKSMRPDLPVIAVTAYALTGDRERCLEAGCDDYLAKPIGKEQLMKMMAQYLGS